MHKEVTCALVIINKDGDILGCHGTGRPQQHGYDLPKGCREHSDTSDLVTAARELKEETGITLPITCIGDIIDCGIYPHNRDKDIHIFLFQTENMPDPNTLECKSFFRDKNGMVYKEVNSYKIIKKKDREKYFYKVLHDKFETIDKFNKTKV